MICRYTDFINEEYDGVAIKGREMVHFNPPDDIRYFEDEYQPQHYYGHLID